MFIYDKKKKKKKAISVQHLPLPASFSNKPLFNRPKAEKCWYSQSQHVSYVISEVNTRIQWDISFWLKRVPINDNKKSHSMVNNKKKRIIIMQKPKHYYKYILLGSRHIGYNTVGGNNKKIKKKTSCVLVWRKNKWNENEKRFRDGIQEQIRYAIFDKNSKHIATDCWWLKRPRPFPLLSKYISLSIFFCFHRQFSSIR